MNPTADQLGTVEDHEDHVVLSYRRHLAHRIDRVWRALTQPDQISGPHVTDRTS